MRSRTLIIVGVFAAAGSLAAGCSSGSSSTASGAGGGGASAGGRPTTLSAALALVPRTAWDSGSVAFGDVEQVVAMNGGTATSGPLKPEYLGLGVGSISSTPASLLGFDPFKVTSAVTLGDPPQQATILYGSFDVASLGKTLAAEGFKRDGTANGAAMWSFGTNGQLSPDNPTFDPEFGVIQVSAGKIIYGLSSDLVEALAAPATTPLSTDGTLAALADCLGSVKAAEIEMTAPTPSQSTQTVAIGLLADSARNAREELCVPAGGSNDANAIASNWTKQIETGRSTSLNEPWSDLLTNPTSVILSGSPTVVRLTAQPVAGTRVGILLQAFLTSSLSPLISPPA